jgi:hypothetical protein
LSVKTALPVKTALKAKITASKRRKAV